MSDKPWTDADVEFLATNWGTMPTGEIAAALGRTVNATLAKGYETGLKRRRAAKPRTNIKKPVQTLCWSCARAGTVDPPPPCSWIRGAKPVEGWTAVGTHIGYCVVECPRFVGGKRG
jgi:hypothetical protein